MKSAQSKPLRFVIITTYPKHATRNAGDYLITKSLENLLRHLDDCEIQTVWRAERWDHVSKTILSADHVFFAGFAIRPEFTKKQHPFVNELLASNIPFSIISAGTSFQLDTKKLEYSKYSEHSKSTLIELDRKASIFTSRGTLTHQFLKETGCSRVQLTGDIAFYTPDRVPFERLDKSKIRRVIVSDPHRPKAFIESFEYLIKRLASMLPDAKLAVAVHSHDETITRWCKRNKIEFIELYKDPEAGLEVYKEIDLHIGFRVHGHVSALKNGKISYLLEQDGRGCEYGLTLDRRISVASYPRKTSWMNTKRLKPLLTGKKESRLGKASLVPVQQVISLLDYDLENKFQRFQGLDDQLESFSKAHQMLINELIMTIRHTGSHGAD